MHIVYRWLLLFYIFSTGNCFAQQTAVEYFIDTDPGIGYGVPVGAFTESSALDFNVSLNNVAEGYHKVYFRAKDSEGIWSHTSSHAFFVQRKPAAVSYVEYFIDEDPGFGNANPILSVLQNEVADLVIPLTAVEPGFHRLSIRSRDDEGSWSVTASHIFYASNADEQASIKAIQYYFENADERSVTLTYPIVSPAPLVDSEFTADLSSLMGNKEYTMYFWAINSDNVKSPVYTKKVKVCNDLPTKAAFDYIGMGTSVSFIDSTENAVEYRWDFGDGATATVSNPVHNYSMPGKYEVTLIASNFCNPDTISATITAFSIGSFFPRRGGNTGSVTMTISGRAFDDQTRVTLVNGTNEIRSVSTVVTEGNTVIHATFELYDQPPGEWDLVMTVGNNSRKVEKAFMVESGVAPKLSIDVDGRDVARLGRPQKFTINISNGGNVDAKGVPFFFAVPAGSVVDMSFFAIVPKSDEHHYDSIPLFETIESLFDQPGKRMDVYGFFSRNVPANASVSYDINVTFQSDGEIITWVMPPFYGSPVRDAVLECGDNIISVIGNFNPGIECLYSTIKLSYEHYVLFTSEDEGLESLYKQHPGANGAKLSLTGVSLLTKDVLVPIYSWVYSIATTCSDVFIKKAFRWQNAAKSVGKNLYSAIGRMSKPSKFKVSIKDATTVYEDLGLITDVGEMITSCYEVFVLGDLKSKAINVVASFDPNEKVGPDGNNAHNYVRGAHDFRYKIYFENLSSASAPAQEVIVIDTLNKEVLDLTTFALYDLGFGESQLVSIPSGLSEYFTDVDLRPTKNMLVRVNAKLDTASGILVWRFLSIDPTTGELIDDPLDGFLPPNLNAPEGEGFVSFSIRPKKALPFGTRIENRATIYFDANAPIETNTFVNTIDRNSPISGVVPLTATLQDSVFTVSWGGSDQGAGVRSYDVYYAVNNNPFKLWQYDVAATESVFHGKIDSLYSFYSIAKDYAGNIENAKQSGEASTQLVTAVEGGEKFKPFTIFPNPSHGEMTVNFELTQPADIKMTLKTLQGQNLIKISEDRFSQGRHSLSVSIVDVAQGFYVCEFIVNDIRYSSKVVKL